MLAGARGRALNAFHRPFMVQANLCLPDDGMVLESLEGPGVRDILAGYSSVTHFQRMLHHVAQHKGMDLIEQSRVPGCLECSPQVFFAVLPHRTERASSPLRPLKGYTK